MNNRAIFELEKINSEEQYTIDNNEVIKQSTLLLEAPKEDTKLLEEFGIDHQIKAAEKITVLNNRQKAIGKLFGEKTYTGNQIKLLCNKYYLKLLPVRYFRGNIPVELSEKIREFADKNDIVLTGARYNFFILAPYTQFTKDPHNDEEDIKRGIKINSAPVLFYREGERDRIACEDEVFTQVYSWGDANFSNIRKYNFLFNDNVGKEKEEPPVTRSILAIILLAIGFSFGLAGYVIFPLVVFITAAIVIYSNTLFTITPDTLWNKSTVNHN